MPNVRVSDSAHLEIERKFLVRQLPEQLENYPHAEIEQGYLAIDGYTKYQTWLGREQQPGPSAKQGGDHFANFIDAVRSRKREGLNAEIEEGAISTTLVHLANISYRLGRTIRFDAASYSCPGDEEATRMFKREYREPFVVPTIAHQESSTSAKRG